MGPTRLRQLLGAGFVALAAASDGARAAAVLGPLAERARTAPWPVPVRLVALLPQGAPADGLPEGTTAVRTGRAELLTTYGAERGGWWLVRPDGHLAARGDGAEHFATALHTGIGTPAMSLVEGNRP